MTRVLKARSPAILPIHWALNTRAQSFQSVTPGIKPVDRPFLPISSGFPEVRSTPLPSALAGGVGVICSLHTKERAMLINIRTTLTIVSVQRTHLFKQSFNNWLEHAFFLYRVLY